jgi:DNA polymerase-3 subunit gamma/tau
LERWRDLIGRLSGGGVALELARHCELRAWRERRIELCLPEGQRQLLPYKEKLKLAVEAILGHAIALHLELGVAAGNSLAAEQGRERARAQAEAVAAIEQDPFVQEMRAQLDARPIPSSIRPLESERQRS